MNVQCVIDNQLSSDFCRQAVHGQVEQDEDPIRSCNILRSFHAAMGAFSCTTQDYNTLLKVICDRQTVACSEISSLIKTLASSCSATMNASALELTGPNACKYVHFLVCHANASVNEAVSYGERVTRAETIMMTKLSDGCRVAISPAYLKNTLDEFCQMVNSAAFSMVQQSVCNISDYTYLTTAMCISNPESIIQDDKLRRDFRELVATLSVKCKDAMFYFEKPDTEENISDACKKLTKFSENLIVTMTCSEREIIRISKLLCNSANTLRLSWVISLAAYVGVIQFHLFTSTSLGRLHSIL
ncbi:hypothetical protein Btru_037957 [Bulinus truncatus]|nr:hypothetical protein Btru_037957 [Bulinus truncatus]